jgi:hypothetical protein
MRTRNHTIDLSTRKGVTLILIFAAVTMPFLVILYDQNGDTIYYRVYDKCELSINLPVHTQMITVSVIDGPQLESWIVVPLRKPNLKYTFNESKRIDRGYTEDDIKVIPVNRLPGTTPACLLIDRALCLYDVNRMASMPQQVRAFVIKHEKKHAYYDDEIETDRAALYGYLNDGYNFSSACNSLTDFLSPNKFNTQRMIALYSEICKLHNLPAYE